MTNPNNLTPPPELAERLKACIALMEINGCPDPFIDMIRNLLPLPRPTLKEQALKVLENVATYEPMGYAKPDNRLSEKDCYIIRAALEQLPDAPTATPPAYFDNTTDSAIREYLVAWINSLRLRDQGRDAEEGALLEQLDDLWRRIQTAIQPPEAATPDPAPTAGFWERHTMGVCPVCGNKRCPKGADPAMACTGSNEPGQPGSAYADHAPTADDGVPLWELMHNAYLAIVENSMIPAHGAGLAAELHVVADQIQQQFQDREGILELGVRGVVAWLRAEADRAEAGE